MGTMLITGILIFNNGFGAHRLLGMLWVRFIRRLIFRIWNAHTLRECLVVVAWAFYEKYRHGIIGLVAAYYYILGIKNIFKPSWKQPSFAAAATALKHILSLGKSDLYGNALYVTWSVFSRHDIFESVDDDGDDRERERKGPTEQRVRDELLPLRAGAKSELSRRKLKIDQIIIFYYYNKPLPNHMSRQPIHLLLSHVRPITLSFDGGWYFSTFGLSVLLYLFLCMRLVVTPFITEWTVALVWNQKEFLELATPWCTLLLSTKYAARCWAKCSRFMNVKTHIQYL